MLGGVDLGGRAKGALEDKGGNGRQETASVLQVGFEPEDQAEPVYAKAALREMLSKDEGLEEGSDVLVLDNVGEARHEGVEL